MKLFFTICISISSLVVSSFAQADDIKIEDLWVREAPPGVRIFAAYMTINNTAESSDTLLSVGSNCCAKVEIHQSIVKDGHAKMVERKSIHLPAETNVSFEPGGLHLMLIDPNRNFRKKMRDGNEVELTFNFSSNKSITLKAKIKKSTGEVHHHNHH